jgi:hypothetical protein
MSKKPERTQILRHFCRAIFLPYERLRYGIYDYQRRGYLKFIYGIYQIHCVCDQIERLWEHVERSFVVMNSMGAPPCIDAPPDAGPTFCRDENYRSFLGLLPHPFDSVANMERQIKCNEAFERAGCAKEEADRFRRDEIFDKPADCFAALSKLRDGEDWKELLFTLLRGID